MLITPYIARVTRIDFGLIAAPLLVIMLLGAYAQHQVYADFIVLLLFGITGWLMKEGGWPRAPLLVGFVLSDPIERNFWLTYQLHGWSWLQRPIVLLLILITIVPFATAALRALRERWSGEATQAAPPFAGTSATTASVEPTRSEYRSRWDLNLVVGAGAALLFGYALWRATGFRVDSQLVPMLAGIPGLIAALVVLAGRARGTGELSAWPRPMDAFHFLLLAAAIVGIRIIGFLPSMGIYLLVLLLVSTRLRIGALMYTVLLLPLAYGVMLLLRLRLF